LSWRKSAGVSECCFNRRAIAIVDRRENVALPITEHSEVDFILFKVLTLWLLFYCFFYLFLRDHY